MLSALVWDGTGRSGAGGMALPADPMALVSGEEPLPRLVSPSTLEGRQVLVVGDSLLKAALPYLEQSLTAVGATDVTFAAMNGSTIGWAADQVVQRSGYDIVVIASGTNNVVDGWSRADARATSRALQMVAGATCPVWIAPTAWRHPVEDGVRRTRVDATSLVALLALFDRIDHSTVHVADWDSLTQDLQDLYAGDGIHHTAAGSAAYARFITAAIIQDCTDTWPRPLVPSRN